MFALTRNHSLNFIHIDFGSCHVSLYLFQQAARCTLAKNSTYSNFITRQVAAYVDRFRTFTVPELKEETAKRGLNKNGKKQQLLMRLALWTRDELVKCSPELVNEELENSESETTNGKIELSCPSDKIEEEEDDSDSDDSSSSSEDELELFDGDEGSEQEDAADSDDEEMSCETNKESSNDSLAVTKGKYANVESSLSESLWDIFGHDSFRDGQEWAIQRCLDEKSSLLVAPTGFGKSLCYALPAALMDGVCIVVSPLISLIQDQLRSLPPRIPAATLSGSVSAAKTAAILDDIVRKRLKILFVSPERLTSPAFRRLFNLAWNPETKTRERKFPEISLLCIDEAHCISQWAHNFRPCFLRFKGFLNVMKPKSILAITATAGPRVIRDIGQTLGLDFPESITEESPKTFTDIEHESIKIIRSGRDNIDVMGKFMSNQEERLAVVAGILTPAGTTSNEKKKPYAGKLARGSVIVYVWRQRDTEVVAESLTAAGIAGGVVIYHGGMDANARAKSQSKFMRGKARICVATVAFGLGIDKADIVGVRTGRQ
jgi:ATP-dependent DNA helicase Q4